MNEADLRRLTDQSAKEVKVKALLLTCMDYRYPQAILNYMDKQGLTGDYDHVILAGASLGANLDAKPWIMPHWRDTFFDHVDTALKLHSITMVYILDHRDCGAYRVFRGLPEDVDRQTETDAHKLEMYKLRDEIKSRYVNVSVEFGLLEKLEGEEFTVLEIE